MSQWVVRHLRVEGETHDRESGWPDLELEMHPIGISLPKGQQGRHLRLRIGGKETWLDPDAVEELRQFIEEEES